MEKKEAIYQCLERRLACSNSRFDVYFDELKLSNGTKVPDFLIVRPQVQDAEGVCGVLVLPEVDGKIGLMRGWRHQFQCEVWQGPAGFIESGESAQESALRELREETGLSCASSQLISLGSIYPDAGLIEGRVALFLARCTGRDATPSEETEVGMGRLEFFAPSVLMRMLNQADNVGGTTLVAGYRSLCLIAELEQE